MPGVGKTSIARGLSEMLDIPHIDIDERIEGDTNMKISDLIRSKGENAFRVAEKDQLSTILNQKSAAVISSGGGAVLDSSNRENIIKKSCSIHIRCDIDEIADRINIEDRPLLYNTNKKDQLADIWNERKEFYEKSSKLEVDITGLSIKDSIKKVYSKIYE